MFAASKSGKAAAAAAATDPYFPYVPLLLNTTSTNGQQNNTFLDSSTNNFTITRNGTPTQGAFTPYQPSGYWSNYFNGTTQYVSVGGTTSLSANFTIEFWFFPSSSANNNFFGIDDTQNPNSLACTYNAGGPSINVFADAGTPISSGAPVVLNSWNHVALVRSSSTVTVYVNGVQKATGSVPNSISGSLQIGRWLDSGSYTNGITGYMSNFRVSNTNIYSGSTFTVPTSPLTSSANTLLLTLQDNRVKDNSSSPKTLTVSGSPPVQAFQPFSPAASYAAATYGGSGYFGGTSDYLTIANNAAFDLGTGDCTIEAWIFTNSLSANQTVFSAFPASGTITGYAFNVTTSGYIIVDSFVSGTEQFIQSNNNPITANSWFHIAYTRSGGTNRLFVNGNLCTTSTNTLVQALNTGGNSQKVGYQGYAGFLYPFNGYISNLRVVKGTAIYTAAFTPPTLPVTAVSGTSLLTNFTNAGIYDAAWQNDVTTVGDAQTSITQYKWSPTSMKFDGTGDGLKGTVTTNVTPVSGDFTWEGWVYFNTLASAQCLIGVGNSQDRTVLYFDSSTGLTYAVARSAANQIVISQGSTSGWSTGIWYYFAVTRSGNNYTIYRNGTSIATGTSSYVQSDLSQPITAGYSDWSTSNLYFNGYLQDVRITKGVARTITTPTAAFPTR
jgi:hypothetical protein